MACSDWFQGAILGLKLPLGLRTRRWSELSVVRQ